MKVLISTSEILLSQYSHFPKAPPPLLILLHERVSTVGSVLGLRSREKTNNS